MLEPIVLLHPFSSGGTNQPSVYTNDCGLYLSGQDV